MHLNRTQLRIVAALISNYIDEDADAAATAETAGVEIAAIHDFMREISAVESSLGTSRDPVTGERPLRDDPAKLINDGGPVVLTLQVGGGVTQLERFATISDAEEYLATSASIDPDDLGAGRYGIDAPHGLGSDLEAVQVAREHGFSVFMSMGGARYARAAAVHNELQWSRAFPSTEAAALAALATIEPEA